MILIKVKEVAADWEPQIDEEDHLFEEIHHFVWKVKTEEQLALREHQKVHNLHIAVDHDDSSVSPEREGTNELWYAIII